MTAEAIQRVEAEIAQDPTAYDLSLSLRSLQGRFAKQEAAFLEAAQRESRDVLFYRLFSEAGTETVRGVAKSWLEWQNLVAVLYSAIAEGRRKERAAWDQSASMATTFVAAYPFPGSIGLAMTISNEAMMLGGTKLDDAIETAFDMARATRQEQIAAFAHRLGSGPIRVLYKWAEAHGSEDLGADIKWRRAQHVRASVFVQPSEMRMLRDLIRRVDETTTEELEVSAELIGADKDTRVFHIKVGGQDVRGRMADSVGSAVALTIENTYKVRLIKSTTPQYWSEDDQITYLMIGIRPN